jgi:thiosulfate/3-mercaptopyruvate sulfurtransferase
MPYPAVLAPAALNASHRLLDARRTPEAFARGHLPGALHADLDLALSLALAPGADPARGGRHPLPPPGQWARQLGLWGIRPETWVVAYDDAAGGAGAARLWWMLRAFGHERVSVLDGDMGNLTLTAIETLVEPAPPYPGDRWLWPTVDLAEVDRLRQDPSWKLLDVRSQGRYQGLTEPFDPVAGHIPGALNLPFAENLDASGCFKTPEALRERYLAFLGDTPPERLAVHCGSGVTACHTLAALERAGLPGSALYVGSWSEWCRNPMPMAMAKGEA